MFKRIYIEITNVCNLNCKFCPKSNRKQQFMSLENFKNIIDKVKNKAQTIYLHVKGEPLLHNNLDEIISYIDKNNLKVVITTNATLLKDKIDILKKYTCIKQINLSIHSITQNTFDNEKYLNNIFESVKNLNNIIVSYRLWNIKNIKDNDINKYIIDKIASYYKIDNLLNILKEKNAYEINEKLYINQDIEFIWPSINGNKIIEKGKCLALREQIAILVDGTVVPCCLDAEGIINLGNINNETLEEILNKELTKKIKTNFSNGKITCELCKTCGFLERLENKRKNK